MPRFARLARGDMIQYLKWDEKYAVGIAEFDEQHKKIMEMLNQLLDAVKHEGTIEKSGDIVNKLIAYASEHFGTEEAAMKEHDYPYLKKHHDEHNVIKSKLSDLHKKCVEGDTLHTMEILKFITHWMDNHLKDVDMNYGPFLVAKGYK